MLVITAMLLMTIESRFMISISIDLHLIDCYLSYRLVLFRDMIEKSHIEQYSLVVTMHGMFMSRTIGLSYLTKKNYLLSFLFFSYFDGLFSASWYHVGVR